MAMIKWQFNNLSSAANNTRVLCSKSLLRTMECFFFFFKYFYCGSFLPVFDGAEKEGEAVAVRIVYIYHDFKLN